MRKKRHNRVRGVPCVLVAHVVAALFMLVTAGQARGQGDVPTASAHAPNSYEGAIEASRAVVASLMREANLPGLQVAVAQKGEILWSEEFGYADLENRTPVTRLTKFRIGSLGKALTAAAAVKLHQQGQLDLDAPIRRYVPTFPKKQYLITSRQLLGHLGGIRHYGEGEYLVRDPTYESVLESLSIFEDDSLLHRPGTRYEYSSHGYTLLSAAIAGAVDGSFLHVMREEVLRPLGMRHTVADHVDSIIPYRSEFYSKGDEDGRLLNAPFANNSYKWAAGGYLSTAEDLVRFGSGLLAGSLVQETLVDSILTSMVTTDGDTTGYAMGWRTRVDWQGRRIVQHGGTSIGGRAFMMLYPEHELAVAFLVNVFRAPVSAEEAQTITHFFLDHEAKEDRLDSAVESLAGTYELETVRDEETIRGTLHLSGSRRNPGWMKWEGGVAPVPIVLVDSHGDETRLIGGGVRGVLNLSAHFEGDGFAGHWNWLRSTSEISGRRVRD